jgi:hypothetical protein
LKRAIPIIVALAIAQAVFANGLGGERLEKVVGNFIVDVGTDQASTPRAGQPIEFDFDLLQSDTREPINLATSVGIDIGHDGKSMVNCDLVVEPPITFLIYTFPERGNYTLTVSFFNKNLGQQRLATATFPLTISGSKESIRAQYLAVLFVIIILGLAAVYWRARRRGAR